MKTKKFLAILLTLAMCLGMLPGMAWATDPVTYLDENGQEQECASYTTITSETKTWNEGWYVVDQDTTISGDSQYLITVNGDVNLILKDSATLTVYNTYENNGYQPVDIKLSSGASLTIYGQSAGSGKLVLSGKDWYNNTMGIGGYDNNSLTINGGIVDIQVPQYGIVINSSNECITINGGTVTCGSYIDGYNRDNICQHPIVSANGTLTINGGTVDINAGQYAIESSIVNINGGDVTTKGSYGITGTTITISGGTVDFLGTTRGISSRNLTITGGTVKAATSKTTGNSWGDYAIFSSYNDFSLTNGIPGTGWTDVTVNGANVTGTGVGTPITTGTYNVKGDWDNLQYKVVEFALPPAVAEVNGTGYETLDAAYAAANAGDTITLLGDVTYGADREVPVWTKPVNIDLGGFTLTTNSTQSISLGNNGYKAAAICFSIPAASASEISISNGTINTAYGAGVYADDPGLTLTLSDLTIHAAQTGVQSTVEYSSAVRITGGATVIIESGAYSSNGNSLSVSNSGGAFEVEGGTFTGDLFISSSGAETKTITITGGTFDADPTAYVDTTNYTVTESNGTYTVAAKPPVARIGSTEYAKLSTAILAAEDGDTIELLCDYDFVANEGYEYYWIDDGGTHAYNKNNTLELNKNNVVLDLNGHSITELMNNSLRIGSTSGSYSNITVKDGTLAVGVDNYARNDGKLYSYVVNVANATGVTFENISTLGGINVSDGSEVTFDGLEYLGTKFYAVCSQDNSSVTINNGDFSKKEAGSANTLFWVESGSSMTINGGTYNTKAYGTNTQFENDVDPVVKGGTFDFDPTAYLADLHVAHDNGDGTWTVVSSAVAKIGETEYATLQAAINAAQDGDTITLLQDVTVSGTAYDSANGRYYAILVKNSITINGGGHKITSAGVKEANNKQTNDLFLCVNKGRTSSDSAVTINFNNLVIDADGYQDVILGNDEAETVGLTINIRNTSIDCEGACFYSNGERVTINAEDCQFSHSGVYETGKDFVYYTAVMAGYAGSVNVHNCSISSFANGVATFPSGGHIVLDGDTVITLTESEIEQTGFAIWARNEDYKGAYESYCSDSEITYSGTGSVTGRLGISNKVTSGKSAHFDARITVTSGTFDHDPSNVDTGTFNANTFIPSSTTNCVASGYKAVETVANTTWVVGVVEATAETTGDPTVEDVVTYTVGTKVKESEASNAATLQEEVAQSVTVTGTTSETYAAVTTDDASKSAVGAAALNQIASAEVANVVTSAVEAAGTDSADVSSIQIVVVNDGVTVDTATSTVTFEVHPEAIAYKNDTAVGSTKITNDQLAENATFTITLDVSGKYDDNTEIDVTHKHEDGSTEYLGKYTVTDGKITIEDIQSFSEFELVKLTENSEAGATFMYNLALKDSIDVKFSVTLDDGQTPGNFTVKYQYGNGDWQTQTLTKTGENEIVVAQCAAKEMTVPIRVQVYKSGTIIKDAIYTVKGYCDYVIDPNNSYSDTLVDLCQSVLDYGAASQTYFNYNLGSMANAKYVTDWTAVENENVPVYSGHATKNNVSAISATVNLESRTGVILFFTTTVDSLSVDQVTVAGDPLSSDKYAVDEDNMGRLRVVVNGIDAYKLQSDVVVTLSDGTEMVYSPLVYAYRMQNNPDVGTLCKTLYRYWVAANTYFNTNP